MIEKINESIELLRNKQFSFYFLTPDVKGSQRASIAETYHYVKVLRDLGYNAIILHEKNDYSGVESWLGEEYSSLPHASIEGGNLKVSPHDFLIVPELFGNVLHQVKDLPCKKIVLTHSYDYILDMLSPGTSWLQLGVKDCITTNNKIKEYIDSVFFGVDTKIIEPVIPEYFYDREISGEKLKTPMVAIHCRDERHTSKIIKEFYLKYPLFRWITFRNMKDMSRKEFANALSECCVSVWVDDISGFGTFPIESMKSGIPVIGKVPNLIPDWMTENNGIWEYDMLNIPNLIAGYIKNWLEDNEQIENIINESVKTVTERFTTEKSIEQITNVFSEYIENRITELTESINKIKEDEEKTKELASSRIVVEEENNG